MPSIKISNERDLVVQLLGELLFVERRLADSVLEDLARAARDDELRTLLQRHRDETKEHAERIETVFHRLEVAPTSNLSRPFESAVAEHDALAGSIVEPRLADVFHAQAALHTEHREIGSYQALLRLVPSELRDLLSPSLDEEIEAAKSLVKAVDRLASR